LEEFNPELMDKTRILAITKSDLIDDELEKMLRDTLPADLEPIFISSVAQKNIQQLKDLIWKHLNQ
jgi:GTP-binding protein